MKSLILFLILFPSIALAVDDATVQAIDSKASNANSKADGNNSRIQALEAEDILLHNRIDTIQLTPGPKGDTGPQGPIGLTGPKGDKGVPGSQGIQGQKGDKGEKGDTGLMGAQGVAGKDGINGKDGIDGAKGEKGDQGIPGTEGPPGPANDLLQGKIRDMVSLLGVTDFVNQFPAGVLNAVQCSEPAGSITINIGGTSFSALILIGSEAISSLYNFSVLFTSSTVNNAGTFLGQSVTVSVTSGGLSNTFAGVVTQAGSAGFDNGLYLYAVRISHGVEKLSRGSGYSSYLQSKSSDIITQLLGENGIVNSVTGTNVIIPYTAKWEESSMNFLLRLMEREGLLYYFNNGHLTIAAPGSSYPAIPVTASYNGHLVRPVSGAAAVTTLSKLTGISGGQFTARSFDYRTKSETESTSTSGTISDSYSVYQEDKSADELNAVAKAFRNRTDATRNSVRGTGNLPDYRAGYIASVNDNTGGTVGGAYLLTSVNHLAYLDSNIGCVSYVNQFTATSESATFLPKQQAMQPKATLTTAIVTNNVDPDALGRIKVKFSRGNETIESDWIRLSTEAKLVIKATSEQLLNPEPVPAETQLPVPTLPDIDDQVVVGFLGGDPDKAIVLGYVRDGLTDFGSYMLFGR